jgi:hypothetical protein
MLTASLKVLGRRSIASDPMAWSNRMAQSASTPSSFHWLNRRQHINCPSKLVSCLPQFSRVLDYPWEPFPSKEPQCPVDRTRVTGFAHRPSIVFDMLYLTLTPSSRPPLHVKIFPCLPFLAMCVVSQYIASPVSCPRP